MSRIVLRYKLLILVSLCVAGFCWVLITGIKPEQALSEADLNDGQDGLDVGQEELVGSPRRPWFMKNGQERPKNPSRSKSSNGTARVWPEESPGDRIVNQLMLLPPSSDTSKPKSIWVDNLSRWNLEFGSSSFTKANCPVSNCIITKDRSNADVLLFRDAVTATRGRRTPPSQIWILYVLENPHFSGKAKQIDSVNWTATYRPDSDLVAPYEKWVYYDDEVRSLPLTRNYAANKTKKVAWFVSNCKSRNKRMEYALELGKYINVDIYGDCGPFKCPRSRTEGSDPCIDMLKRDYKFYLSFENANCRHYITEKFYVNGLQSDLIPIVMGAHPDDYLRLAPQHSYIHADDFPDPKALAGYLYQLDNNDAAYNTYFEWKGTGEFINTYFFCRLCAMLHDNSPKRNYDDFNMWWKGEDTCRDGSWAS